MARILAIDYGTKRTGLAVTDPLQLIATGLTTVPSSTLIDYLKKYTATESVEKIIVGMPRDLKNRATDATHAVEKIIDSLKKHFPQVPIVTIDERFSSKLAAKALFDSGVKKKQRQDKGLIDEVSATILLQDYMQLQAP